MKQAIIMPGMPSRTEHYDPKVPSNSNDHWYPWLSRKLILRDIHTVAIEPPLPFQPRYDVWKREFERFEIGSDTGLIGHSCGGGFLVRWLSENKDTTVDRVILVAPWMNPDDSPRVDVADFFDFDIDRDLASRTKELIIYSSNDDEKPILQTVDLLRESLNDVRVVEFENKGHFCKGGLGSVEFPELLEEFTKSERPLHDHSVRRQK